MIKSSNTAKEANIAIFPVLTSISTIRKKAFEFFTKRLIVSYFNVIYHCHLISIVSYLSYISNFLS